MKVISAVAALAAIGATSALKLKLPAHQPFDANAFMTVLKEQYEHPEGMTHPELLQLSDEEFQAQVLGEDHGFTDEHVASFKDYHHYNLKLTQTQRLEMHLGNFKRMADEEQALLQEEEIETSLLEEGEGEEDEEALEVEEGEGGETMWYRRRRRRRRRRWKSWRRRRRKDEKKNGPNYSPHFTHTQLWEFLDIMYKVKTGLNANWLGNNPGSIAGGQYTSTTQGCILHSANSYQGCNCRFVDEGGSDATGAQNGDTVCLAFQGTESSKGRCALGFRGSDSTSDWVGYLGLFAAFGYNNRIFGNPERWSIYAPKPFAKEWDEISWYTGNLVSAHAGSCTHMAFVGASLGGALAEIAYEQHKGSFSASKRYIVTLDTPKISSKKNECGDEDTCTGCRQGSKYYRAWYKSSLISAVPNRSMWGMMATVTAVLGIFAGIVIPWLGPVIYAVAVVIVAYCVIAMVVADNYHHVTSTAGSFRLDNYGNHSGRECQGNPGWPGWGGVGPTGKYHSVTYWMGGYGDNTWYMNGSPSYEDPTATPAPTPPPTGAPTSPPTPIDYRRRRRRRRWLGGSPTDAPTLVLATQGFTMGAVAGPLNPNPPTPTGPHGGMLRSGPSSMASAMSGGDHTSATFKRGESKFTAAEATRSMRPDYSNAELDCTEFCALDAIDKNDPSLLQRGRGRVSMSKVSASRGGEKGGDTQFEVALGKGDKGSDDSGVAGSFSMCDCDKPIIDPMEDDNGNMVDGGSYPWTGGDAQA